MPDQAANSTPAFLAREAPAVKKRVDEKRVDEKEGEKKPCDTQDVYQLETLEDIQSAVCYIFEQAQQEVLIKTLDFAPQLINRKVCYEALSRVLRRNRQSMCHVLVEDLKRALENGHRLIELSRKLPSSMSIRLLNKFDCNKGANSLIIITDKKAIFHMSDIHVSRAIFYLNDPRRAKGHIEAFREAMQRSKEDPNLRQFML